MLLSSDILFKVSDIENSAFSPAKAFIYGFCQDNAGDSLKMQDRLRK